jgi:hypothetical protein
MPTRLAHLLPLLLAALLLGGCGPRLLVAQAPDAGLPGPATYAWGTGSDRIPGDRDPRVNNDIVAGMVQHAVDQALAGRGYRAVARERAAWLVHYHAGLERKSETVTEPLHRTPVPRVVCDRQHCSQIYDWGFYGPPEYVTHTLTFHQGTLIIDIHDAASGRLVWRGQLSDDIDVNKAVDPQELDAAVAKLMRRLPSPSP